MKFKHITISIILLIALFIPSMLIHEAGHILVCKSLGLESIFWVDVVWEKLRIIAHTNCQGISPSWYYVNYIMGGTLSGFVFMSMFLIKQIRCIVYIAAPVFAIMIRQYMSAILETIFHDWYILNDINAVLNESALILSGILISTFIIYWIISNRKK